MKVKKKCDSIGKRGEFIDELRLRFFSYVKECIILEIYFGCVTTFI